MRYQILTGTPNEMVSRGTYKSWPDCMRKAQTLVKEQIKWCQVFDKSSVTPLHGLVEDIGKLKPEDSVGPITFMNLLAGMVFTLQIRRVEDE